MKYIVFVGACLALFGFAFGVARFALAQITEEEIIASPLCYVEDESGAITDLSELCGRESDAVPIDGEVARVQAILGMKIDRAVAASGAMVIADEELNNDPTLDFIPVQTADFEFDGDL